MVAVQWHDRLTERCEFIRNKFRARYDQQRRVAFGHRPHEGDGRLSRSVNDDPKAGQKRKPITREVESEALN